MSEIKTERLHLRQYTATDRDDYIALVTDPEVMAHIEGGEVNKEVAEVWWDRLLNKKYPSGERWCADSLEDSRYIGHAMINQTRPNNEQELGYTLPKSEWGMGYATEIAKALAEYSRDMMGLERIFGTVDEEFEPSINVLKKIGMKFFGYDFDKDGRYLVYVLNHKKQTD